MRIPWLTAFLDFPHAQVERGSEFWLRVSGTALSPRRGDHDEFATLVPADGDASLRIQDIGDAAASRIHLDLATDDLDAAGGTARDLGASLTSAGDDLLVFTSPGGLPFCLVPHHGERGRPRARTWPGGGRSDVDQVCLDIPPAGFAAEVEFWRDLTGWIWSDIAVPEYERLDGPGTLRILLQRLDDEAPRTTAHLDLASDDVRREVARHVTLGARELYEGRSWVTLEDPTGLVYCVTGRSPTR